MKRTKVALATLLLFVANLAAAQTTLGTGANAQSGLAIGANAYQVDVTYDSSYGALSGTSYTKGIVIGEGSRAMGNDIVIGSGLLDVFDGTGISKLLIGGRQTDGKLVLRRVSGMADGVFKEDGVTLGQLNTAISGVTAGTVDATARAAAAAAQTSANTAQTGVNANSLSITATNGTLSTQVTRLDARIDAIVPSTIDLVARSAAANAQATGDTNTTNLVTTNTRIDNLVLNAGSAGTVDLVARDAAAVANGKAVTAQGTANTALAGATLANTRLNGVDSTLTAHDTRITVAQATADASTVTSNAALASAQGAVTVANAADSKATTSLQTSIDTQAQVVELTTTVATFDTRISSLEDRVNGLDKRIDAVSAMGAAMSNATMPNLNPGERAAVAGVGMSGGQAAVVVGMMASNYAGQVFGIKFGVVSSGKVTIGAGVGVKF